MSHGGQCLAAFFVKVSGLFWPVLSITEQDKRFYDELKKKLDITELEDGLHIVWSVLSSIFRQSERIVLASTKHHRAGQKIL